MAVLHDAPHAGLANRIELDSDNGYRPLGGLKELSDGRLDAFVDEQGVDRPRLPAARRSLAKGAKTGAPSNSRKG